ncbi:hypothetical protein CORC01_09939 [Colletotrichum orchidophilum]|uniref:Galactosyl transferase GMA12/MNN10 family protein n=1 Tax=Colletotrichum orchidophilum TaxID=1209926 RepID=A0A1G4B097_9PEZI|nr:uncharacterized protein CORC01_09939 [Colletotrichum orchidophilum]OHE94722.1 hypothetical protein CORC01_09939 [Colletotrichum orchidophilum]
MYQPKLLPFILSPIFIKSLLAVVVLLTSIRTLFLYYDVALTAHVEHATAAAPLRSQRETNCLPQLSPNLSQTLHLLQSSCQPAPRDPKSHIRITTVTAQFGKIQEHYQNALQSHVLHTTLHGAGLEVMCTPIVDDLWNKPAYLLSLLLDEMLKPPEERTEWLFWADRDTIILDQCRPISSFLPHRIVNEATSGAAAHGAVPKDDDVHLVAADDWNGLNNGVFLLRVSQWAIELFSAILAFRHFRPGTELRFTEQSAMEILIKEKRFNKGVRMMPQHWFNSYPGSVKAEAYLEGNDENGLSEWQTRRGDFLIHFAGLGEDDRGKEMASWLDMLGKTHYTLEAGRVQRNITSAMETYWEESESEET